MDDIPAVVINYRREIIPTPTLDFETYKYENLYAVRQGGDIPIGCCGYGGNKEDIRQKNISI
ncbi:hypothetical protein [Prevotella sp. HMSC077E09]|uniref:hypothetical protein n=1 Tax=Prevotella sp. HMSC077E09 TaxID=1739487 RepID=UPI0014397902|nr:MULTISPECIES: hypothetical protein [unclassified Prevotella]